MKQQEIDMKMDGLTPVILMVAITVISAAVIAGFVFGMGGTLKKSYYYIEIEESTNGDFLLIRTLSYNDDLPLTNVSLSILEHGEGRLLSGPDFTNETGYGILQIPKGYSDYFDIVGNYKDVTQTFTVDTRPHLVKSENKLGSLGTGLIITTFSSILGFLGFGIGWLLRGKVSKTDKIKEKPEDKI